MGDASGDDIVVAFKVNTGKKFDLSLQPSLTVLETKQKAEAETEIPASQQRLIYRGRILKDPDTLSSYGISSGHTIHLVRSSGGAHAAPAEAATAPASTTIPPPGAPPLEGVGLPMGLEGLLGAFDAAGMPGGMGGMPGGMGGMPGGMPGGMGGMPGGMDPAVFQSLLSNPMVQNMMQQFMSNPEMLQTAIQGNPFLSQMATSNPVLQSMLSNPELVRGMFSPEVMRPAMQMQQAMHNNPPPPNPGGATTNPPTAPNTTPPPAMGAMPGGMPFVMPPGAFGGAPAPVTGSAPFQNIMNQMMSDPELMRSMLNMMGGPGGAGGGNMAGVGTGMNPNMGGAGDPNMAALLGMMGGAGPAGGGAAAAGGNSNVPPAERYRNQLQQLEDMGFIDKDANIMALQRTGGDVNAAIAWLLESGHGS